MKRFIFSAVALVFIFQLLTLNSPGMNGDESIFMLLMEELRKLAHGQAPSLNPLIDYSGPLDFWLMGSLYALTSLAPWLPAGAWMVRIIPFLAFWAGLWVLYQEIKKWSVSEERAHWALLIAAIAPMNLIYSRVAFQHSLLLCLFSVMLAESLRVTRTGEVRWLRLGFLFGFSAEVHTTAFVGVPVLFIPVFGTLFSRMKKEPARAALAVLISMGMAYTVVRNFPPPASVPAEMGHTLNREVRNFLNMVSGQQPFAFRFHTSPPAVLCISFLLFLAYALFKQLKTLIPSRDPWDRTLLKIWGAHFVGSAFLAVMCYRGRSLALVGHERYFLVLVPGWTLIWADAFMRLKQKRIIAPVLFAYFFLCLVIPVARNMTEKDPSLLSARWLEKECPREKCLAYAQNFWNYWPIRYYTRDSIDLNFRQYNWKPVVTHQRNGRSLAGCWLYDSAEDLEKSETLYRGPFKTRIFFPPQSVDPGQVCFTGIELEGV